MGLVGSILIKGRKYELDYNPNSRHIDLYHIEQGAQDRARELREQGYLVRVRRTLCTEGTEEVWQVFKALQPSKIKEGV